jgi:hypothetical protein
MFLPVCELGHHYRRRSVPPVSQSAPLSQPSRAAVGRERPPFGCPLPRPTPGPPGVAHAPRACHDCPARQRDAGDTAELAVWDDRGALFIRITYQRLCQVLPEDCVHIGERAPAPNLRLRRHRVVTFHPFSDQRVSVVS